MSNERFINKYKNHVKLIQALMKPQRADQVGRIYHNTFVLDIGSDQDFFEAINWFAVRAIDQCCKYSLICSRRHHYDNVRYWNQCITALSFILGCSCTFDCWSTHATETGKLLADFPRYLKATLEKVSYYDLP